MLNLKSFLTVDFGAGSLKLAEFEVNESGGLRLKTFAIKSLGAEGAAETTREATILKALQEALVEKGIKSKNVNVCAPGVLNCTSMEPTPLVSKVVAGRTADGSLLVSVTLPL